MPQREFWTTQHPSYVRWEYQVDPRHPEDPSWLLVAVHDQEGRVMDAGGLRVPLNVVHEAVSDLLVGSWEAYLFGELGDVAQTMKARGAKWGRESKIRPRLDL